jgi:Reverse transcriptase (RNA-dependent DNA polymerase)
LFYYLFPYLFADWSHVSRATLPPIPCQSRHVLQKTNPLSVLFRDPYLCESYQKGFSQIPGKVFQENHAPVVSDRTLHLLLAIKTEFKLSSVQFDIVTAFLYGELEEELWMAIPNGYPEFKKEKHNKIVDPKTQCLRLIKAISARKTMV